MGQVTGPLKMSPMQLGLSEREQGVGPLLGPVTDLKMTVLWAGEGSSPLPLSFANPHFLRYL